MARFLDKTQEKTIISAIQEAENNTSGEIRVHIETRCKGDNPLSRAIEVFGQLEMHHTEQRNGTLIYIATKDKKIAIWGDKGINEKVGDDFWQDEFNLLTKYFKQNQFATGIAETVIHIGEKLKQFFPYQTDDINELPDDISYGDDDA